MSSEAVAAPRVERRNNRRFQLALNLRYLQSDSTWAEGQVLDISSGGIRFQCDSILSVGKTTQLVVPWPLLLNGDCRLQLRVYGRVLRNGPQGTVLRIRRYEFQTAPKAPAHGTPPARVDVSGNVPDLSALLGQTVR